MQKQAIRASVYRQAAIVRLAEAEYLEEAHPAGAIYLGGYVVECMLKWAICQRHGKIYLEDLPDPKLPERLTGARGHDLGFLLDVSGLRPALEQNRKLHEAFIHWKRLRPPFKKLSRNLICNLPNWTLS